MARKRYKKQAGGLISNFFGGFGSGQGMDLLSQVGSALQGFSSEPALSGIFSQSDQLYEGFNNSLTDAQRGQFGDSEQMKPIFDLFSLFTNGMFGGGGFQDGGVVEQQPIDRKSPIAERFGQFTTALQDGVVEAQAEQRKQVVTQQFNSQYGDKGADVTQIIPGIEGMANPSSYGKVGTGQQMQSGGVPVSPMGQYQYPGQPVIVPTPDGRITMQGVNQDVIAVQNGGATVLPANSGMHQLQPGNVLEIPLPPRKKSTHGVYSKKDDKKGISTRIPTATVKRYNERNRRQMRRNRRGNVGYPFNAKRK
jgi:hypothetical protein